MSLKLPKIPDPSATPEEVRSYLTHILTTKYTTDPEFAKEASASWKIGRGAELHSGNLAYFQQIFGNEVGFCLFQTVLEARQKAWQNSYLGIACIAGSYLSLAWTIWWLIKSPSGQRSSPPISVLVYGICMYYYAQFFPDDTCNHGYLRNYLNRGIQLGNGIFWIWIYIMAPRHA
ncbi:hypothetical protein BJX76DRAFT_322681 [Aspergillus varians]